MMWSTSVNQPQQQQQQQLAMVMSKLDGDGLQGSTFSAPDRPDVEEPRPASAATATDAVESAAETESAVETMTVRHDPVSLPDDDNDDDDEDEEKLVIDSSAKYSSDLEETTY